jgi:hypothetical protein
MPNVVLLQQYHLQTGKPMHWWQVESTDLPDLIDEMYNYHAVLILGEQPLS